MQRRKKLAVIAALLAALHGVVLLAGFFAPYDPAMQNRESPYAPPARLHFADQRGHFHLRPFLYAWVSPAGAYGEYEEDHSRAYSVRFFVGGSPYKIAGLLPARLHLFGIDDPGQIFVLGSDAYGRDLFSRMLYGGQISLLAGLLATGLSLGLGLVLGALAGFYTGWVDEVLMRGAELFLALPWLYLLFAIRAFLPLEISPAQAFLLLVLVIGMIGWARPARLVRGVVLSARERDYVCAARGFGASDIYLLRRHVLPQTFGLLLTQAALLVPQYILAEVTLSFLGLGVGEPVASWGNLLSSLQRYDVLASYWWMYLPGLALLPFFFGYTALAHALHEEVKAVTI